MNPESGAKPTWQRFLESSGGTALITVLIGGLLGQWVSYAVQTRVTVRETLLADKSADAQREFETHKEMLAARLSSVQEVLGLIGETIAAADDLITITGPEWDVDAFLDGEARTATLDKKRAIRETYNETDARWRSGREALGFRLSYYHGGSASITSSWRLLQEAITRHVDCARTHYLSQTHGSDNQENCNATRSRIMKTLDDFVAELGESGGG